MTTLADGFNRTRCWLRAHPVALDGALAATVFLCMVVGSFAEPYGYGEHGPRFRVRTPDERSLVLMTLAAAALVHRRRDPMAVLVFTGVLTAVELVYGNRPAPVAMAAVIALYTVASRTGRATTWRAGLLTMTALTGTAMFFGSTPWYTQENLGIFAWTGMAAAAGDAVRSRRDVVEAIKERAERAERTRDEEARRRVAEERLRIARDLHDVVAHHIALVNVQAGVAAHVMDRRPDQAKEALAHVREASRSALNELRATVGLLRQSGDPEAPTEPAPGLDVLDELVTTFRQSGLPVEVARADEGTRRTAAVDLAAYRIIQEALTNVRKHAGPDAKAEVSVIRVGSTLEVTVLDNGISGRMPYRTAAPPAPGTGEPRPGAPDTAGAPGVPAPDAIAPDGGPPHEIGGTGHGLLGMRERVSALGGRLTTGPRYGGGFRVQAILPLTARSGEDT
ncbi:sensor histidine kinase [Streptomyces qinzhouensis]|uniref:histidine kinase n=1 Tax=Streptomyces qinzhouensis TaxID=2599401 RepID=A0A5B8IGI9_9ACTN|nr:sensor histidine kinase [Streptomyces qinzhouensis]QDY76399.1 sensor histidine kinase [Streptomyces qinzhouensis]